MDFTYETNRIYLADDAGKTLAEVTFPDVSSKCVNINHTFVDQSLSGQGIASKLVEAAALQLRKQGKRAFTSCSYAAKWFAKHSGYLDVFAGDPDQAAESK